MSGQCCLLHFTHGRRARRAVEQRRHIAANLLRQHERLGHVGERLQTVGQLAGRDARTVHVRLVRVADDVLLEHLRCGPVQRRRRPSFRTAVTAARGQLVQPAYALAARHQTDAIAEAAQHRPTAADQNVAGAQRPVHDAAAMQIFEAGEGVAHHQRHYALRQAGGEVLVEHLAAGAIALQRHDDQHLASVVAGEGRQTGQHVRMA